MKYYIKIKRMILSTIACSLVLCLISVAPVRADATVTITTSGNTEVGGTITVTITAGGEGGYSGFDGSISYDSQYLAYVSGSLERGPYQANFSSFDDISGFAVAEANIANGTLLTAKFTCLKTGSATISCSVRMANQVPVDLPTVSDSTTVNITTPVPKSSNANLAGLTISPGSLTPSFSSGTQSYSAVVAADQSKIAVSAIPSDGKSKVSLNGVQNKLVSGTNTVKITVTAEDGSTKVYTIIVTRSIGPTPTATPTPVPLPLLTYNGVDYMFLPPGSTEAIPDGFILGVQKYQGVDIPVLTKTFGEAVDAPVMTLVLLTAEGKTAYFVYDEESQTVYPYQLISSSIMHFQILDKSEAVSVPAGYEVFDFQYLDNIVSAYRLVSDPSNPQILLFLTDDNGVSAFYYYDTQNGMLMLYRGEVNILEPALTPTAAPELTGAAVSAAAILPAANTNRITFESLLDYKNPVVILIYLVVLLCLILLIICIILIAKKDMTGYADKDYEYEESPEGRQKSKDIVYEAPFVSPEPEVFFNEFGQPPEDNTLYFGDRPPDEEVIPDFPTVMQSSAAHPDQSPQIVSDPQKEHRTENERLTAPGITAGAAIKRIPSASREASPEADRNDPDYDPDDN